VSEPERLPLWWPAVERVEDASPEGWTKVLVSPQGKPVRADYTVLEAERPRRLTWRHEVAGSPFERILAEAVVEIRLELVKSGATRVAMTERQRPRGLARLGWLQMRRASARRLDGALDRLQARVAESS
jgi:uncharacterized protein YndB with AHSA1/START domain